MLDILKKDNYEFLESKICDINSKVSDLLNKAKRNEESSNLGKVIDWYKYGYQQIEKPAAYLITKKKVAVLIKQAPEVREVAITNTVDYVRLIDTSDSSREFILTYDEIIQLAIKQGLFR